MKRLILKGWIFVLLAIVGMGLNAQAPVITSLNPTNGTTGVAVNQVLSVTFDQNIQFGFGEIGIWRYSDDVGFQFFLTDFDPEVTIVGNTMYITHNNFENSTQYYITIEAGSVQSLGGIDFEGFSNKSVWNFSTISLATPPVANSFDPIPGSIGVAINKILKIEFDQPIQFGTGLILIRRYDNNFTHQSFRVQDFPVQLSITGGNTLEINHNLFLEGVRYYVSIQSGAIKSLVGGLNYPGFLNKDIWSFTTVMPPVPPLATFFNPINGATNVSVDQVLSISFNQNIQLGIGDIEIRRGDGSLFQYILADEGSSDPELSVSGSQLFINHGLFENGVEYYVTISDGAIRSADNGLNYAGFTSSTQWRFTTAYPLVPPLVVSLDPVNGATGVLINKTLEITFDQSIKLGSGDIEIRRYNDGSLFQYILVEEDFSDVEVSVSGNKLSLTHNSFSNGMRYYVIISPGAILSLSDQIFAGFSDNSYWNFTTESAALPPGPLTFTPIDGATNVALNQVLSIEFDQPIQIGTGFIRIRKLIDGAGQSISLPSPLVTVSGSTLFVDHDELMPGIEYYVTIGSTAILSLQGVAFAGFNDKTTWNFTTTQIGLAPAVTAFDPVNGAVGVVIDKVLNITFDQNIQLADGEIVIRRYSDDSSFRTFIADGASSDPELIVSANVLSIIDNLFEDGVRYYVTISNGAIQSSQGVNFPGISDKNLWSFTISSSAVQVTNLIPANEATGVALDQVLSITFDQDIRFGTAASYVRIKRISNDNVFQSFWVEGVINTDPNLSITGNTLSIQHNNFLNGTGYYVEIGNGAIESLTGTPYGGFTGSSTWSFTTLIPSPVVTTYNPLQGATNVGLTQSLALTFDQDIQFGNGPQVVRIRRSADDVIFQTYAVDGGSTDPDLIISGNVLTFNHLPFDYSTAYYVTISDGAIESLTGIPFAGFETNSDWSFATVLQALSVIELNPINAATEVPVDQVLTITFDQNIRFASALNEIRIRRVSDNTTFQTYLVNGVDSDPNLSITGPALNIQHNPFATNQSYYVTIGDGAIESLTGNPFAGFSGSSFWNFTTIVPGQPPLVIEGGLSPLPGATGVLRNENLIMTFNETIQRGTGFITIFDGLGNDFTSISAQSSNVVINGAQVTISHPLFAYGTDYYIIIPAGFFKSLSNVDFAGFSLSTDWYFRTETTPPAWVGDPYTSDQNQLLVSLNGEVDADGSYYFVITSSTLQPTAEQIEAGLNNNGVAALVSGNGLMFANQLFTYASIDISGLTAGTDYFLHIVAKSGSIYTERRILVIDRTAPIILSSIPLEEDAFVDVNIQIVLDFNEKLYRLGQEITNANINTLGILYLRTGMTVVPVTASISTDGRSFTIIPNNPLLENTNYTLEIYRLQDGFGNEQTSRTYRNFQTDKLNRWIGGGVVSNWSDPDNWQDGDFTEFKSVLIPLSAADFPVITAGSVNVNNIIVEAGALLTQTGGTLSVTGIFNLQSSAIVNASYIKTGGTLNVMPENVRIEQVVSSPSVTYFFSSPVSGATPNSIGTTSLVYQFNNSSGLYSAVPGSNSFAPGRGYATRSTQPLIFSGIVNQGNINQTVFRSIAGFGWNLVGNPYPASIDWTLLNNTNLEDAFWIWNQDFGNYGVYNSGIVTNHVTGPVIPSNQAFLIKVLLEEIGGNVGFLTSAIVKNTHSYLKASSGSTITPHIKLVGVNGSFKDEVAFAVSPGFSHGIDRLDTEKYFSSTSGLFELYSQVGSMSTVISSYPTDELIEIPLGYNARSKGAFAIEMAKNILPDYQVILVDKSQNKQTDITNGGRYDFTVDNTGKNITRFKVQLIKQATSAKNIKESDQVAIFVNDGTLFVEIRSENSVSDYQLLDLNGRVLRRGNLINLEVNRIEGLDRGAYILQIVNKDNSLSNHKVVVF